MCRYNILYHSYQDCPIDLNILHSVPFHDHEIVPPNYFMARALRVRVHHNTHESYVCSAKCRVHVRYSKIRTRSMN